MNSGCDTFKEVTATCFHVLIVFVRPSNSTVRDILNRSIATKCCRSHSVLRHIQFACSFVRSCHPALRLVGQKPGPSQATDMALACCFLGKVLGVGCHYFPPPLDIPTFAARYLHVCTTREILVANGVTVGENIVR